jgi:tRNA A37 threonylcarbamoyladenosine biosynthesis protein TsaE
MDSVSTDIATKVGVNILTEIFKATVGALEDASEWIKTLKTAHDPLGLAAKQYVRKMEERYNSTRIMGMTHPIPLRSIYVRVNVLEKITARHQLSIDELQKFFDYDRKSFGSKQASKDGMEVVNNRQLKKIIVLGKPGAGKTTFLKFAVLQAIDGKLAEARIPVFIAVKDWADSGLSLMEFILTQFDVCDFPNAGPFVNQILKDGKCIFLMDGLDEVNKRIDDVILEIRSFSDKYSKNQFILSCRIAAYNYWFEKFVDVEVADFSHRQIETFISNWFGAGTAKAELGWQKVREDRSFNELAATPLLLTMLCLAFDETMDFPSSRAELYKEGIDALLKKWDSSRSIKRDTIYRHLSPKRKESMLARIAAINFEEDHYFVSQRTLEKQILAYIQNLPEAKTETLEPDSEAILKAIEAQHGLFVERAKGIYSFSHLTFQEYFTAKYIVDNATRGTLKNLVKSHLTNDRWREVFLLTAGLLDTADEFFKLMQIGIGAIPLDNSLVSYFKSIKSDVRRHLGSYPPSITVLLALLSFLSAAQARAKSVGIVPHKSFAYCVNLLTLLARDLAKRLDVRIDITKNPNLVKLFDPSHSSMISNIHRVALDYAVDQNRVDSLSRYLKAGRLLLDCLRAECYVTQETRHEIYRSLFVFP